jgi:alpha-1,2-mannosyltransferase
MPQPRWSQSLWFRIGVAGVVIVGCALLFQWLFHSQRFFDLKIYMSALDWWLDGHDLYDYAQPDALQGALYFTYPPFAALVLLPFALLPLAATQTLFTLGTVLAVLVTTDWMTRSLRERLGWPRWYALALAAPLILIIEPLRTTLSFGQLNMLLVVLVMLDLLVLGPRGSRWTGIGIGLAAAIKLFPALFIVYLLVSRQWRAAAVATATAAVATLAAVAIAPRDSWDFWTSALWDTSRVGRSDYTANQSLQGLLARLVTPEEPNRPLWVALVAIIVGYGMWRAARAGRLGDPLAGLALTGVVAGLISPLSWVHHLYWFAPAMIVMITVGVTEPARRLRWLALTAVTYVVCVIGVDTFIDWGSGFQRTDSVGEFLARNAFVLLSLALVIVIPIRERSWRVEPEHYRTRRV